MVICIVGAVTLELRWVHATSPEAVYSPGNLVMIPRHRCNGFENIALSSISTQVKPKPDLPSLAAYIQRAGLEVSTHH